MDKHLLLEMLRPRVREVGVLKEDRNAFESTGLSKNALSHGSSRPGRRVADEVPDIVGEGLCVGHRGRCVSDGVLKVLFEDLGVVGC